MITSLKLTETFLSTVSQQLLRNAEEQSDFLITVQTFYCLLLL